MNEGNKTFHNSISKPCIVAFILSLVWGSLQLHQWLPMLHFEDLNIIYCFWYIGKSFHVEDSPQQGL